MVHGDRPVIVGPRFLELRVPRALVVATTAVHGDHPAHRRHVSHATDVPLLHRAHPRLAQQLAHARRYERPLTAVVWSLEKEALAEGHTHWPPPLGDSGSLTSQQHCIPATLFQFFLVGSLLRAAMRESDLITYDVIQDHYVVLFPELIKPQALRAVRRLSGLLYQRTHLRMRAGLAAFPVDGLTLEVLIKKARTASTQQLAGEAPAAATSPPSRQRPRGVPVQALRSTWAEKGGE